LGRFLNRLIKMARSIFADQTGKFLFSNRKPRDVPPWMSGGLNLNLTTDEIIEFIHEGRGNDRW